MRMSAKMKRKLSLVLEKVFCNRDILIFEKTKTSYDWILAEIVERELLFHSLENSDLEGSKS
jgi:hypothetical protein